MYLKFNKNFSDYGVQSIKDLHRLEDSDYEKIDLTPLDKRNIQDFISSLQFSDGDHTVELKYEAYSGTKV